MQIRDIYFQVIEGFIIEATSFPTEGERWFKNNILIIGVDQFLT